jgi:hypothetical protein
MNFDFLDRQFFEASLEAVKNFQQHLEDAEPPDRELNRLCEGICSYGHCDQLDENFLIGAVDGSGDYPVFQQDDIFIYLVTSSAQLYQTDTNRQHKLSRFLIDNEYLRHYLVLPGNPEGLYKEYQKYFRFLTGKSLQQVLENSDYIEVYSSFGKKVTPEQISWDNLSIPHASQVSTQQYLIRTMAELAKAIHVLNTKPKYVLIDTSFVYFLLGEAFYLPEILKRYLKVLGLRQNTGLIALSKSHNIPSGDLLARKANEIGYKDHWYLRLPSSDLEESVPGFLEGREIPPKLCVSYLFKFHGTMFPMRIDVDVNWWIKNINNDQTTEKAFFRDLDYCCHDVRCYGYPYPLYAAHRSASLTKRERRTIRDILRKFAMKEGLIRDPFDRTGEDVHMGGV